MNTVVLGYPPVRSSCIWVCLLHKCEISNSYCRAMTRFGIRPCEKIQIIFNSDLKFVSVLSNVDRKYYKCIPKKRQPFRFQSGDVLLVHTKERWHDCIPFFCQKTVFLYFGIIISPSQRTYRCTSDIFYIFFSFIIKSSIYAVFRFVSLRDRIFIIVLLMIWPEYLFLKKPSRSLSESNGHPLRDTQAYPEGDRSPFLCQIIDW